MARKAREKSSTGIYAVSLKGQSDIFKTARMKEQFSESCKKYINEGLIAIKFHADKVEMLIKESEKGISMDMKPLITSFARAYNRENDNEGKVFADRFKSIPVEDDKTKAQCIAYLNGGKESADVFKPKRSANKTNEKKTDNNIKAMDQKNNIKPQPETIKKPEPEIKERPKQRNLPTWLL